MEGCRGGEGDGSRRERQRARGGSYLYGKVKSTERQAATKHGWPLRIY